jgi:hypothetical protein
MATWSGRRERQGHSSVARAPKVIGAPARVSVWPFDIGREHTFLYRCVCQVAHRHVACPRRVWVAFLGKAELSKLPNKRNRSLHQFADSLDTYAEGDSDIPVAQALETEQQALSLLWCELGERSAETRQTLN